MIDSSITDKLKVRESSVESSTATVADGSTSEVRAVESTVILNRNTVIAYSLTLARTNKQANIDGMDMTPNNIVFKAWCGLGFSFINL